MSVPHPARAAAAAVFGGLSTLRRRRSLPPDGASYHATVDIDGDTDLDGAPLLAHAAAHLLLPGVRGPFGQPYSTILPYRAAPFRGWRRIGSIDVGAPLGGDVGERLRFNPWNTGGGIRPAGPFQGLRDPAYSASQRARLTT
jgi:hypothetical protein